MTVMRIELTSAGLLRFQLGDGVAVDTIALADDLRRLDEMDARRHDQLAAVSRISDAFADVPLDELERQVALALAEVRAEARAEDEITSHQ